MAGIGWMRRAQDERIELFGVPLERPMSISGLGQAYDDDDDIFQKRNIIYER